MPLSSARMHSTGGDRLFHALMAGGKCLNFSSTCQQRGSHEKADLASRPTPTPPGSLPIGPLSTSLQGTGQGMKRWAHDSPISPATKNILILKCQTFSSSSSSPYPQIPYGSQSPDTPILSNQWGHLVGVGRKRIRRPKF